MNRWWCALLSLTPVVLTMTLAGPAQAAPTAQEVLFGPLLPEGAPPADAYPMADPTVFLGLDLGRPVLIKALLLQAAGEGAYRVEVSEDGAAWRAAWLVGPEDGAHGLRTRATVLDRPDRARYVRVRPGGGAGWAVSRLWVLDTVPARWPPPLRYAPQSRVPLWPRLDPTAAAGLKAILAGLGLGVVGWSLLARCQRLPSRDRLRRSLLAVLGLSSIAAWWNFGNAHYEYGLVHPYEVYHYAVGAKYFRQLGYTHLYVCSVVAEAEDRGGEAVKGRWVRDLSTYAVVRAESVLESAADCHSRFSPGEWQEFRADVRWAREALPPAVWTTALQDHGFNATPAWLVMGTSLARLAPLSDASAAALCLVDVGLLLVMWVVLLATFGLEAACVAALFWGLNGVATHAWTGGAFLRHDWLFWSAMGICALRTERRVLAGFSLAYAALLRVFPVVILGGVALGALSRAFAERRAGALRSLVPIAAGALAAVLVLVPLSWAITGRAAAWAECAVNMRRYVGAEGGNLVGAGRLVSMVLDARSDPAAFDPLAPADSTARDAGRRAARQGVVIVLAGAYLLGLARVARREPDWTVAVLATGLVPVAVSMASYYCEWLLLYGLLWRREPRIGVALVGLAWATGTAPALWERTGAPFVWAFVIALAGGALLWLAPREESGAPRGEIAPNVGP